MKQNNYQCSQCGQKGHNKRTCGQQPPLVVVKKAHKASPAASPSHFPQQLTPRNIVNNWDDYLTKSEKEDTGVQGDGFDAPQPVNGEPYSLEDLETLWMLKNGADGKLGKGKSISGDNKIWTEESNRNLVEFVATVEAAPPGVPTATWYKFFKNFGATAKQDFVAAHEAAPRSKTWYEYRYPNSDAFFMDVVERGEGKPLMPAKLFPVFLKDPSVWVRKRLAGLKGIPEVIVKLLSEDDRIDVAISLMENADTTGETLISLERRIQTTSEKYIKPADPSEDRDAERLTKYPPFKFTSKQGEWKINYILSEAKRTLVSHRNLPEEVALRYFDDKDTMSDRQTERILYHNRNLPVEKLVDRHKETTKQLAHAEKVYADYVEKHQTMTPTGPVVLRNSEERKLAREVSDKQEILNNIIATARCPQHMSIEYLSEALKEDDLPWGKAETVAALVGKINLEPEQMEHFYDNFQENLKTSSAFLSFAKNRNAPKSVLKKIAAMEKAGVSYYTVTAIDYAKEKLKNM